MLCKYKNSEPRWINFENPKGEKGRGGIENNGNDGFYVYVSEDLINWENKGLCLEKKNAVGDRWFWAPEVSYYKGKFYMLYSAEENLAIAVSESPTGPFVKLTDGWLRNRTIDGHLLFDDDGSIYIYFAELKNNN